MAHFGSSALWLDGSFAALSCLAVLVFGSIWPSLSGPRLAGDLALGIWATGLALPDERGYKGGGGVLPCSRGCVCGGDQCSVLWLTVSESLSLGCYAGLLSCCLAVLLPRRRCAGFADLGHGFPVMAVLLRLCWSGPTVSLSPRRADPNLALALCGGGSIGTVGLGMLGHGSLLAVSWVPVSGWLDTIGAAHFRTRRLNPTKTAGTTRTRPATSRGPSPRLADSLTSREPNSGKRMTRQGESDKYTHIYWVYVYVY